MSKSIRREAKIAAVKGELPKIVIPVHMADSADMAANWQLSKNMALRLLRMQATP